MSLLESFFNKVASLRLFTVNFAKLTERIHTTASEHL